MAHAQRARADTHKGDRYAETHGEGGNRETMSGHERRSFARDDKFRGGVWGEFKDTRDSVRVPYGTPKFGTKVRPNLNFFEGSFLGGCLRMLRDLEDCQGF